MDDKKFSITGGSFKKYVTCKMTFSNLPSPYVALYHFFFNPPPPCVIHYKVANHGMKQKKIFLCIWLLKEITLHQKRKKRSEITLLTYACALLLHIDIHIYQQTSLAKWWN